MKSWLSALALIVLTPMCVAAQTPTAGTIISMQSVACGTKQKGKKEAVSLLCQQYLVRTATTEYQIRQPKPSQQSVLPLNMPIQFTIDKDKFKFTLKGKKYEFLVVGASAVLSLPSTPGSADTGQSVNNSTLKRPL